MVALTQKISTTLQTNSQDLVSNVVVWTPQLNIPFNHNQGGGHEYVTRLEVQMANGTKVHDPLDRVMAVTVTHFPETKKCGARTRVKCGCCWETLDIYADHHNPHDDFVEIGGVMATRQQWREIFNEILGKEGEK